MAVGDKRLSENGASGHILGTGADLTIVTSFYPQVVMVLNTATSAMMYWTATMDSGSANLTTSGSGGATFTGNILGPHDHPLFTQTDNGTFSAWRVYTGAITGTFQVGETVTGGTSLASGTFLSTGTNIFGYNYLNFSTMSGGFDNNEVVTGGTSGAIATTTSVGVAIVTPTTQPSAIMGIGISNGTTDFDALYSIMPAANNSRLKTYPGATYNEDELIFEIARDLGVPGSRYAISYLHDYTVAASAGTPTGTITGGSGGTSYIATNGVTPESIGFTIGNDGFVNVLGDNLFWFALR